MIWGEDSGGPGTGKGSAPGPDPGADTGAAILLAHSGLADHRLWDPIWPELASRARVIRYDARGYGRPAEEEYCLEPEDPAYGRLGAISARTMLLVGAGTGPR